MAKLEELSKGVKLKGILPNTTVTVVDVSKCGNDAVTVVYRNDDNGRLEDQVIYRSDEQNLEIVRQQKYAWRFDADGALFRLVSEALRIDFAHLFDRFLAIHTSQVEPYPHQITAVYEEMLPRQPLRFLLADDPGAGKTIMAGLLIKELMMRGDLQRCLIVVPGNLVIQWQRELKDKFELNFKILSNDDIKTTLTENVFEKMPLVIARVDKLKRDKSSQEKKLQENIKSIEWDLIICDEAHKMSASFSGGEVKLTKRYKLGQILSDSETTRHFLLMTATPHNGKEEDFQLFMGLLDPDRFEGKFRNGVHYADTSDMMRRMLKEDLVDLEGKPLLPERLSYSLAYHLSYLEELLYKQVTEYVEKEFNRADKLEKGRKTSIGFALTILQRRLASSPEAIYKSLQGRRERLENKLRQKEDFLKTLTCPDSEDLEDFLSQEIENLEDEFVDQATAASTIAELLAEINKLEKLVQLAQEVLKSGTDTKWEELSKLFKNNPEMFDFQGQRRKIIVFTEHRATLDYLVRRVSDLIGEKAVATIHGGIKQEDRQKIQDAFNQNPTVQVLVANDAAGEGINLHESCHLMINYDLPWNPNRLEQRFGRIHRIGQTEICHLWNLVAADTREGQVFQRVLEKLEVARKALGGKVFDVLGEAINGKQLGELLIEAIRYGDTPDNQAKLEQAIEEKLNLKHLQNILEKRSLYHKLMDTSKLRQIYENIELSEVHKLQPHFIINFFVAAFQQLDGKIQGGESGRYEVTLIPVSLRHRLPKLYRHICFEKAQAHLRGKPPAEFIYPGHPLLNHTIDLILEPYRALLKQGCILVDENDLSEQVRILVYLEHSIQDARKDKSGNFRIVSRQMQYVEIDSEGHAKNAGYAPYLDYRPLQQSEQSLLPQILNILMSESLILQKGIEEQAQHYAIQHLVPLHKGEVQRQRTERINKTIEAVKERLTAEINYCENQAEKFRLKIGVQATAQLNYDHARRRAEELKARREKRLAELEQERNISAKSPVVLGGALIVPMALLQHLKGETQRTPGNFAEEKQQVEKLAMEAVMAAERKLGFQPRDVSADKCGYDIESCIPGTTNRLRIIEVKGRIQGASTVTVTKNEIITALNKPDSYILALVEVSDSAQLSLNNCTVRYVHRPFQQTPDFAVTSVNYSWSELWVQGKEM
ncbi:MULTISPECIES: helicase-related protein [unclassified Microcoleus]|uniref:helicase-related protein n=1 Tax=unclassified Microcoleus TaxID=2642155 RepID=UPI002FCEB5C8